MTTVDILLIFGLCLSIPFIIYRVKSLFNIYETEKEKEMQHKMKEFDMKDVHSGYVVMFRNGTYALVMRVGDRFTKIFTKTHKRAETTDPKEGVDFFYTSAYKGSHHYAYSPVCNRTKPDPDYDVVAVYGLVEGVKNYLEVGNYCVAYRPLLWEENIKEMTLEEIEKKLGHKVKIVNKDKPAEQPTCSNEWCSKCVHDDDNECGSIESCYQCKAKYGWDRCKCMSVNSGEPCPYFKEAE